MDAGRDWLIFDPPVERDWLRLESPCACCLELEAKVERRGAALGQANRERREMFAEIFRLTALVAWRQNPPKLGRKADPRTARRRRANPPDALNLLLRWMVAGKKIKPRYLHEVSKPKK